MRPLAADFPKIKYKDCFICYPNGRVFRNATHTVVINPKKRAVKHSPLDLVRRVPDEAATLSLAKGNIS
jgi:hypothetical protein